MEPKLYFTCILTDTAFPGQMFVRYLDETYITPIKDEAGNITGGTVTQQPEDGEVKKILGWGTW